MSHNRFRAAVLGSPIEHSLSPVLHSAAYREISFDGEYLRFDLGEAELETFLKNEGADFNGFSLTMPLKRVAFEIARNHDETSRVTKVCNTLIASEDGWRGFNTDVTGFIKSFSRVGITAMNDLLVVGAGATARSAIAAAISMGANDVKVMARRPEAIGELQDLFPQIEIVSFEWQSKLPSAVHVINTVSSHATKDLVFSEETSVLFDVIYAPWPTSLAAAAEEQDILVLGGLELLVAQAVEQVLHMTGCNVDLREDIYRVMYDAGFAEQARRSQLGQ